MSLHLPAQHLRISTPATWRISASLVPYESALKQMEERVEAIAKGTNSELIWLLQHPPLFTAGTSAIDEDLLTPDRFPVYHTGRGGQFTYHGPGQRVVYVMLDLNRRGRDVRALVRGLEDWLIGSLGELGVVAGRRKDRVGVWVARPDKGQYTEDKIAAIGIRLRRWVSFHGVSLNVAPELEHYSGIVPCGITQHGITSLEDLGISASMQDVDAALRHQFIKIFGPLKDE